MFLTPQDVADATCLDRRTVYRLIKDRKLPAYKLGGSVRIRREDYDSWLASNVL